MARKAAKPEEKRPRGRPTKFNAKVSKTLIAAARKGLTLSGCAYLVKIHPECLRLWLRAGRRGCEARRRASREYFHPAGRAQALAGRGHRWRTRRTRACCGYAGGRRHEAVSRLRQGCEG